VAQLRRWFPLAVAALATVLVAGSFGFAVDQFATPHTQQAPQLKTVPAATLSRLGVALAAPNEPLYCGVTGAVISHGWLHSGAAGCAIAQSAAETAARQGGTTRVVESVLAMVTSSRVSALGRDLLAWVVVTQQTGRSSCLRGLGGYQVCVGGRGGFPPSQVVVVDAHSGQVVSQLPLAPAGGFRPRPAYPAPGSALAGA
jgi:hypothetical protein